MKTLSLVALSFLIELGTMRSCFSQTGYWESRGPGTVSVMASNPTDLNEIITGSSKSGIFKSTDRGETWKFSGSGLPLGDPYFGADVTYLKYDPINSSTIYAGTGLDETSTGRGIFKSTDGGETWRSMNVGLPNSPTVRCIDVSVHDPNIIFASVLGGSGERRLYKSTNKGESWSSILQYQSDSG